MTKNKLKFQCMPKRFRIWDNKNKETYSGCSIDEAAKLFKLIGKENAAIFQDTGLKDKNGDEIFEGDIISARGETYQVYWDEEVATWRALGDDWDDLYCIARQAEIIGNIFANPELLEKV